jgi:membrane protein implicated in regulation of membrane protease activity
MPSVCVVKKKKRERYIRELLRYIHTNLFSFRLLLLLLLLLSTFSFSFCGLLLLLLCVCVLDCGCLIIDFWLQCTLILFVHNLLVIIGSSRERRERKKKKNGKKKCLDIIEIILQTTAGLYIYRISYNIYNCQKRTDISSISLAVLLLTKKKKERIYRQTPKNMQLISK